MLRYFALMDNQVGMTDDPEGTPRIVDHGRGGDSLFCEQRHRFGYACLGPQGDRVANHQIRRGTCIKHQRRFSAACYGQFHG
jgi:hypothetical protein